MNTLIRIARSKIAGFLALLILPGCLNHPFERANKDYADAFASVANQQLLLNIARLANDEPAYYIQLGNFTAQYGYQGNITAPGAGTLYTRNFGGGADPSTTVATGGPNPTPLVTTAAATLAASSLALSPPSLGFTYSEQPSFTFTPLSGDAVTKALFAPLPNHIFSIVFSNWHADAAIRTAVESIKIVPAAPQTAVSYTAVLSVATLAPPPVHREFRRLPSDEKLPVFTVEPSDLARAAGEDAEFMVQVNAEVTCRWQVKTEGNKEWDEISDGPDDASSDDPDKRARYVQETKYSATTGNTTSTLKIEGVTAKMNQNRYRCRATEAPRLPLDLKNDPRESSYPLFLSMAYELWKAQYKNYIPTPYESTDEKAAAAAAKAEAEGSAIVVRNIKLSDAVAAQTAGYTVKAASKSDPNSYKIFKNPSTPDSTFPLQFPDKALLKHEFPLLYWIVRNRNSVILSLRSFDSILYEVAKEDQRFRTLGHAKSELAGRMLDSSTAELIEGLGAVSLENIATGARSSPPTATVAVSSDENPKQAALRTITLRVDGEVETFDARPILRLTDYTPEYHVVKVRHQLRKRPIEYIVGDFEIEHPSNALTVTPSIYNQTEFTLLSYLFSQASIDSTKLPVQQLI